jgi:hypothetical protein
MSSKVTVTAKTGPASQVTTLAINNVTEFTVDIAHRVLRVNGDIGLKEFDLTGVTTFTVTPSASGSIYTVVVS